MYVQKDLVKIKSGIAGNVGHKVRLKSKQGRKQIIVREGVIENTYPSIFTVKLDVQNDIPTSERRVSYSYTDVLTKAVEVIVCEPEDSAEK
ncbi:MAG: Veg family protein [Clostridia bacterium]|nr:Veg family protein [Clostridia bacterium]